MNRDLPAYIDIGNTKIYCLITSIAGAARQNARVTLTKYPRIVSQATPKSIGYNISLLIPLPCINEDSPALQLETGTPYRSPTAVERLFLTIMDRQEPVTIATVDNSISLQGTIVSISYTLEPINIRAKYANISSTLMRMTLVLLGVYKTGDLP